MIESQTYSKICENPDCRKEFPILMSDHARSYCNAECRRATFTKLSVVNKKIPVADLKANNKRKQLFMLKESTREFEDWNNCFSFDSADCY